MPRYIDVCNGDADGLCATVQWRLHDPAAARLITGLKRDIALLGRVQAQAGDQVNVFDVSMQRNQAALRALLDAGVHIRYADHHATGEIPVHPLLSAHIDLASDTCTSLIIDKLLDGAYRAWALVGAYGDNLTAVADALGAASGYASAHCQALRHLGEAINYNAYGEDESQVCIAPVRLFGLMLSHADPMAFIAQQPIAKALLSQRDQDMREALGQQPSWQNERGAIYLLPNEAWSHRASGSLANHLANAAPHRAHAVITHGKDGHYMVSVRAPLMQPFGADVLCRRFGGNGRARSAGIDALPEADLQRLIDAFLGTTWGMPMNTQV